MRALVVIPAYNEERELGGLLERLAAAAPDFDVAVVDDGSTDRTAEIARAAGAVVLRHPFNLGYGAALQTGYRWALARGYDVVVQMDGDGQHEPADVPALAEPVLAGRADAAYGSRFHSRSNYRMSVPRRLGSRWCSWLVKRLTGVTTTDPTTGFQALSEPVLRLYATEAFPVDYPDADMIVLLARSGFRIVEVPVRMYERRESPSMHSGLSVFYYPYKMTLAIVMNALRPIDACPPQCALRSCRGLARRLYRLPAFDVVACRSCGIVFRHPLASREEMHAMYEDEAYHASAYFTAAGGPERAIHRRALDLVRRHRPSARTLLDVGCGSGAFLAEARRAGFEVRGVEFSHALAEKVRQELAVEVDCGEFEQAAIGGGPFDVVTMWDVLEHVRDPIATLHRARSLLVPSGLLAVLTIDRRSLLNRLAHFLWIATAGRLRRPLELLYDRRHNFYFDGDRLGLLLAECGFETIERETYPAYLGRWLSEPVSPLLRLGGDAIDFLSRWIGGRYRQLLICRPRRAAKSAFEPPAAAG